MANTTTKPKTTPRTHVQINVPIPVELHKKLRIRSINDGRDAKDIVNDALTKYLG